MWNTCLYLRTRVISLPPFSPLRNSTPETESTMHRNTVPHQRHPRVTPSSTIFSDLIVTTRPNKALDHRNPPGPQPQPPKNHLQLLYWRFRRFSSKPYSLSFKEHQSIGTEISSKLRSPNVIN